MCLDISAESNKTANAHKCICMGFEPDVVEQGKKTFDGTSQTLNTSFFSAAIQSKSWSEE